MSSLELSGRLVSSFDDLPCNLDPVTSEGRQSTRHPRQFDHGRTSPPGVRKCEMDTKAHSSKPITQQSRQSPVPLLWKCPFLRRKYSVYGSLRGRNDFLLRKWLHEKLEGGYRCPVIMGLAGGWRWPLLWRSNGRNRRNRVFFDRGHSSACKKFYVKPRG